MANVALETVTLTGSDGQASSVCLSVAVFLFTGTT